MAAAKAGLERETELERVVGWRLAELERAGYERRSARKLAERLDVDLHRAVEMIRSGCPAETALEILL